VRKFKNVSYPVKTLISSQKFRDISRNFVIFRDTKFREIKKLFREIRNKNSAKFRNRETSSTTLLFIVFFLKCFFFLGLSFLHFYVFFIAFVALLFPLCFLPSLLA
jgi:uncharacterized membrane protein YjjP (DUF1212 family)